MELDKQVLPPNTRNRPKDNKVGVVAGFMEGVTCYCAIYTADGVTRSVVFTYGCGWYCAPALAV